MQNARFSCKETHCSRAKLHVFIGLLHRTLDCNLPCFQAVYRNNVISITQRRDAKFVVEKLGFHSGKIGPLNKRIDYAMKYKRVYGQIRTNWKRSLQQNNI